MDLFEWWCWVVGAIDLCSVDPGERERRLREENRNDKPEDQGLEFVLILDPVFFWDFQSEI